MSDNYRIFNDLNQIHKKSNMVLYLSLIFAFATTTLNIYFTYKANESAKNSFYLLDNGQKLATVRVKDNKRAVDILCEGHVSNFHQLFFALEPDMEHIKRNIEEKALYLGDHSVRRLYNRLMDQNYYDDIAKSGYSIELELDSLVIEYAQYPFTFEFFGKQKIIKNGNADYRNLMTRGYLEETKSTPNNLNGLKITNLKVIDNNDL